MIVASCWTAWWLIENELETLFHILAATPGLTAGFLIINSPSRSICEAICVCVGKWTIKQQI